ncbi:MAG: hypothetical protein IT446_15115 [Phycisphaerales bacterium]|nr:hypothetical protein [Phycisphaerales bacterium]
MSNPHPIFHVSSSHQPIWRELGLDAEGIFADPRIVPWRTLPDRENCTLDATLADGRSIRWHIKRYPAGPDSGSSAQQEAMGIQSLHQAEIPTVRLAGWGLLADGRSFLATEDLAGYRPADKLLEGGFEFDRLLNPMADLAARLHNGGLHHRDLYLCHFFVNPDHPADIRLIDPARVRPLPGWPLRRRWIVKDLAQLWYSLSQSQIPRQQAMALFERYANTTGRYAPVRLLGSISRKAARIARHDVNLRRRQPGRNISIPG